MDQVRCSAVVVGQVMIQCLTHGTHCSLRSPERERKKCNVEVDCGCVGLFWFAQV